MKRIITEPVKIQSKDGRVIAEYLPDGKVKVFKGSFFRNIDVNTGIIKYLRVCLTLDLS